MLAPKRTKFRKAFKGRIHGMAKSATDLDFGNYGLKATTADRVTSRQIEAARRAITRHLRRAGKVWIRIFPDVPVSQKPAEVRMGKGKGNVDHWAFNIKFGFILCEINTKFYIKAIKALKLAQIRLPIKTKILFFG